MGWGEPTRAVQMGGRSTIPKHTKCQQNVSQMFQKYFSHEKAASLCHTPPFEPPDVAGSLAESNEPIKESGPKAKATPLALWPLPEHRREAAGRLLPPQGKGTLVLQLDGRVPLLRQHLCLLEQTPVLLLQLLQTAQVGVVDGDLLAVSLPQGVIVLLDHLQLVHGRVVQLIENF